MKFSILINCHNQNKYIYEAIYYSLNQKYPNFEIIVVDSSKIKINYKKFLKHKNFKYFHLKEKYKYPEMNQMFKIMIGLKKTNGNYICLLDGDDKFSKEKIKKLAKIFRDDNIALNQDKPILFGNNKQYSQTVKNYKKNFIFKKIFVSWPQVFGTSSITVKRNVLNQFFKYAKPFKWKYLAIDIQLLMFCDKKYYFTEKLEKITFKREHNNNLGTKYMNIFSKIFWKRRSCQHNYSNYINGEKSYNFDYFLTCLVNKFL